MTNTGISTVPSLLLALPLLAGYAIPQNPQWSTFFGGSGEDYTANSGPLAAANGDVFVWGWTTSTDLPTKGAFQSSYAGGAGDAFIARLDPAQTGSAQLVWCTYLGGSAEDRTRDVVLDAGGRVILCGWTDSSDFPTTPGAFDTTHNGQKDAFVAVLDPALPPAEQLVYSTFLGADQIDAAWQLAVDPAGLVVVAGNTGSTQFPIRGTAYQPAFAGGRDDGFVAVLAPALPQAQQLLYSTFLGGTDGDVLANLALDSAGKPVVSGWTNSTDFPTTANALQGTYGGGLRDGFVSRLDLTLPQAQQLTYSTYLGGTDYDWLLEMSLAPGDAIAVGGETSSSDFPTTAGAFDRVHNGGRDAFVTLLDTRASSQLAWSTFFGGSLNETVQGLAVESCGLVTASGGTRSVDLPTTLGAFARTYRGGNRDAYVARFDPGAQDQAQLHYASYLGGDRHDERAVLSLGPTGNAVVNGRADSRNFPTTPGAFATTHSGGSSDMFVTELTMHPAGVARHGASTPACSWPIYQGVNSWPARGNLGFAVHTCGAPVLAPGAMLLGVRRSPFPVFNITLLVTPLIAISSQANALGHAQLGLAIPANTPLGAQVATQWIFVTTVACPGTGPLAASEGLELTIQ